MSWAAWTSITSVTCGRADGQTDSMTDRQTERVTFSNSTYNIIRHVLKTCPCYPFRVRVRVRVKNMVSELFYVKVLVDKGTSRGGGRCPLLRLAARHLPTRPRQCGLLGGPAAVCPCSDPPTTSSSRASHHLRGERYVTSSMPRTSHMHWRHAIRHLLQVEQFPRN